DREEEPVDEAERDARRDAPADLVSDPLCPPAGNECRADPATDEDDDERDAGIEEAPPPRGRRSSRIGG
ncbi:MAG TPA: hypothetical protein VK926_08385, partial [Gaiellaceae bacterium]|nr:hypothetical protein [Gaiellaceae bacterium]